MGQVVTSSTSRPGLSQAIRPSSLVSLHLASLLSFYSTFKAQIQVHLFERPTSKLGHLSAEQSPESQQAVGTHRATVCPSTLGRHIHTWRAQCWLHLCWLSRGHSEGLWSSVSWVLTITGRTFWW